MSILATARLTLRTMTEDDAGFMLALLNDPAWLRMIGDRGVRSEAQAMVYIREGAMACQAQLGYSFYVVQGKEGKLASAPASASASASASDSAPASASAPLGICGLARREYLDAPDIGFAFLPQYRSQGYAYEAAAAVLEHARHTLRMPRVLATTRPYNSSSARLLHKLGMKLERRIAHPHGEGELLLFATAY